MSNKQPFYHRLEVLFTATADLSEKANERAFLDKLEAFLKRELGRQVVARSVMLDAPCDAEPGDPYDLM